MKKISIIFSCLFLLIGVICILFPTYVTAGLPYLLGGAMAVYGAIYVALYLKSRTFADNSSSQLTHGLVLLIMGAAFIVQGANSLGPMGTTWAIIGIRKASASLGSAIQNIRQKDRFLRPLLLFLVRIALALLLLFYPVEKFSAHVMILGLELIAVSIRFTLHQPFSLDD